MSAHDKLKKQGSEPSRATIESSLGASSIDSQQNCRKGLGRKRKTPEVEGAPAHDHIESSTNSRVSQAAHNAINSNGSGDGSCSSEAKKPRKNATSKKRCASCNRKIGLATTFTCRCGENFCTQHRYAESHECTFDYKEHGRKELIKNNPLVCAEKFHRV